MVTVAVGPPGSPLPTDIKNDGFLEPGVLGETKEEKEDKGDKEDKRDKEEKEEEEAPHLGEAILGEAAAALVEEGHLVLVQGTQDHTFTDLFTDEILTLASNIELKFCIVHKNTYIIHISML